MPRDALKTSASNPGAIGVWNSRLNAVARVYLELERAGVLQTRRGIGTFVASGTAPTLKKSGLRDPELRALVQRCLDEAAVRGFSADEVLRLQTLVRGVLFWCH